MSDNKPYGSCPICGADGKSRERRPNGDDTCIKGHKYKSADSITNPDTVTLPRETDLSGTTRARIGKDGTVILRHFNCDETNEFYLTALEATGLHEELTKAMEVKGE